MEAKETEKIKESLINLPSLVAKIEAYFTKETPAPVETPTEEPAKEEPKAEVPQEQDFSAVITAIEKQFTKTSDFDTFKASLIAESTKVSESFTALQAKVDAQEGIIKEVFELVKKIADAPAEPTKFAKKDGAKTTPAGNMNKWMAEAAELTKKNFK